MVTSAHGTNWNSIIRLRDLLAMDRNGSPEVPTVSECFGDQYLCANNSVYANVRRAFFSFDGRFSTDAIEGRAGYELFPMAEIQSIMESGVVPVQHTSNTLKRILSDQPSLRGSIVLFLRKNSLLRNSALCVAHRFLSTRCQQYYADDAQPVRLFVFLRVLGDAYARTAELMGAALADSDEHRLIFSANSEVDADKSSTVADAAR